MERDDRSAHWLRWERAEVAGRTFVYGEAGEGPTLLFLHGWALDHRSYKRALSRLVAAGHRVVAPALPGFGGSGALAGEDMTFSGYSDWVADFLGAVGVEGPVVAIGHSFGGGVAISLAHDHPSLVRGLVLVNSVGGSAWTHRGSVLRSMSERPLWDWGIHFPADLFPLRQARRVVPVIVREAGANALRDPVAFWRVAGLARTADLTPQLEALKRRGLPVVVLWGNRDQVITQDSFEDLCQALGNPEVRTVEGNHAWLLADPDAFGEVMTNVLGLMVPPDTSEVA